jgi:regulation of enolase protein 1 (concanavalin A-like superfamily)
VNLLGNVGQDGLGDLQWTNPTRWEPLPRGGVRVVAQARTDFFRNPDGSPPSENGHLLWVPVEGDFVAQAHVRPSFSSTYDAGALMVRADEAHWAKLCYEATDFGTHAIVSVVTEVRSDDANGVNLDLPSVWLQIVRLDHLFVMHYAEDGKAWRMTRYFSLDLPSEIAVGMVAQSPVGPGTMVDFLHFSVERRRVDNPRAGV